jgi:cell division ATPase FtsA
VIPVLQAVLWDQPFHALGLVYRVVQARRDALVLQFQLWHSECPQDLRCVAEVAQEYFRARWPDVRLRVEALRKGDTFGKDAYSGGKFLSVIPLTKYRALRTKRQEEEAQREQQAGIQPS